MMPPAGAPAAVVLAGGQSRRMGEEKAVLDAGGATLVERRLETLAEFASELIVSVPHAGASMELRDAVRRATEKVQREIRIVPDQCSGKGPLEGLRTSLSSITADAAWVVAVDSREVHRGLMTWLGEVVAGDRVLGCMPSWSRGPEPGLACYRRELLPAVERLMSDGRRALRSVAELPGVVALDLELPDSVARLFGRPLPGAALAERLGELLGSLNTPQTYERWRSSFGWERGDV